jgi:hypothetical protein
MKELSPDLVDGLVSIFKQEIQVYKDLLKVELAKKSSIMKSDAKKLEEYTHQTMNLVTNASSLESKRMKQIATIYDKIGLEKSGSVPILSEFLDQIDKVSYHQLKGFANELTEVVRDLKEKISINEKLLQTKQEIYSMSIEALKDAADVEVNSSYQVGSPTKKGRTSVLLNTSV